MILNTNISWDYWEFSSTNLGYLVDNCSGLLTDIWAFTVCFPIGMLDTGLDHSPFESQLSGDGSSELQRAFYKEEREEEWDIEQEGSMLKGSRLPRGCVFFRSCSLGPSPCENIAVDRTTYHCPAWLTKECPLLLQQSAWWSETMDLVTFPLSVLKLDLRLTWNFSLALPDWMWSDPDQIFVSDLSVTW